MYNFIFIGKAKDLLSFLQKIKMNNNLLAEINGKLIYKQ